MSYFPRSAIGLNLCLGLLLVAQAGPWTPLRAEQQPLKVEGKQSLWQRVLARPGARLFAAPRPEPDASYQETVPFAVFYVYGRASSEGTEWVHVGANSHGDVRGWIRAEDTIAWRHTLTVAFKDPLEHDRVLLFRDPVALKSLIDSHDVEAYAGLLRAAEAGSLPSGSPVIAIQPRAEVDITQNFYLVPIFDHEDVYLGDEQALLLEVATVPNAQSTQAGAAGGADYRSGIVFVTDTTLSMGPYIDRTQQAISRIYEALEVAGLRDRVGFGLVAYRDNTTLVPELEYLTRVYARPVPGTDPRGFLRQVGYAQAAPVSSQGFNEDAFAGVMEAIEQIDWTGFDARYIVLITDAGPRLGSDRLGATGLNADALRQLALDRGIALWALHLHTAEGRPNHQYAAGQYQALADYPGIGAFYYPVAMGSVAEFGEVLETVAGQIVAQVQDPTQGLKSVLTGPEPGATTALGRFQEKVEKLGYALRMRYLQRQQGEGVPSVFQAWMVDRDFRHPERQALDVRVLLTRDQLSDLQSVLRQVLDAAEEGVLSPSTLLDDLKSLAASISRDPAAVGASTRTAGSTNLADLGYMREYIEGLPYRGEVMDLALEQWEEWPANRQFAFISALESKVSYYQALHDNTDLWISLDGGPVSGDSVYPIALSQLP